MSSYLTFYHTIWVRDHLLVANVNYIRTKKFARRFLCLMIKSYYILIQLFMKVCVWTQEIVLSRLKHPDVLLVLMQLMKVLVETDEETEW